MKKKDILIIECFQYKRHFETAGEIALKELKLGRKVSFSFIDVKNLCDHINRSKRKKYKLYRVNFLQKILSEKGVSIVPNPKISDKKQKEIIDYANNVTDDLEELKKYDYKNASLGLGIASSIISYARSLHPNLKEYKVLLKDYLIAAATTFELTVELLEACKPKTLITFNGRFACAKAIAEAGRLNGVEVFYHERGSTLDKYELFEGQPHDFSLRRSEIKRYWQNASPEGRDSIGNQFFELKRAGHGIGSVNFTEGQTKNLLPQSSAKRKIVYYSSSDDECASVGDIIKQPIFPNQRDAILSLISWVKNKHDIQLFIRVHPHLQKKSKEDREWWNSLKGENVTVIPSESKMDSYALMDWADLVVSYGSTAGVEASFWGTPSILLGDSLYSEQGCVYEPGSLDEVLVLLDSKNLPALDKSYCLPYGHYFMNYGKKYEYYKPDNSSSGTFCGKKIRMKPKWHEKIKIHLHRQDILECSTKI